MQLLTDDLKTFGMSVLLSNVIEIAFMILELRTTLVVAQTADVASGFLTQLVSFLTVWSDTSRESVDDQQNEGKEHSAFDSFKREMTKKDSVATFAGISNEQAVEQRKEYFQAFYDAVNFGHLVAIPVAGVVACGFEGSTMRQRYVNGELGIYHGIVQIVIRTAIMLGLEFVTDFAKGFLAYIGWGLDLARYSTNTMSLVFLLIVLFDTGASAVEQCSVRG